MIPHVDPDLLKSVADIASQTRNESKSEAGRLSSGISTRTSVEIAGLLFDGFGLDEAAEVTVYPQFSDDGGLESERTYVKQLVQKYVSDGSSEDLFNEEEIEDSMSQVSLCVSGGCRGHHFWRSVLIPFSGRQKN